MKRKYVLTRGLTRKAYDCVHGERGDPIFDIFMRTYYVNGPFLQLKLKTSVLTENNDYIWKNNIKLLSKITGTKKILFFQKTPKPSKKPWAFFTRITLL